MCVYIYIHRYKLTMSQILQVFDPLPSPQPCQLCHPYLHQSHGGCQYVPSSPGKAPLIPNLSPRQRWLCFTGYFHGYSKHYESTQLCFLKAVFNSGGRTLEITQLFFGTTHLFCVSGKVGFLLQTAAFGQSLRIQDRTSLL